MRIIREHDLAGKKVLIKELTVGEIRTWLSGKVKPGDMVDAMLFDELSLSDIPVLTSLTPDELEDMSPSEIDAFLPAIREVNARFFTMREKVAAIGRQILADHGKNESGASSDASPV